VSALVLTVGLAHPDAQSRAVVTVWRRLVEHRDYATLAELLLYAANSPETLANLSPEDHTEVVRQIRRDYPAGGAGHVELVSRTDVRPLLASIDVPTLVVVAGQDRIVLPDTARELASGIEGAALIEYPAAGHIFTTAEAQRWAADVAAFLDRLPE
jgi:pimeloyl-ACP methyl ester carboxylesterase